MTKRKFVCKKCRSEFVIEVYEEGEAEEKRVPTYPVRCPRCGSGSIERK
jgi:transposase-like protein